MGYDAIGELFVLSAASDTGNNLGLDARDKRGLRFREKRLAPTKLGPTINVSVSPTHLLSSRIFR